MAGVDDCVGQARVGALNRSVTGGWLALALAASSSRCTACAMELSPASPNACSSRTDTVADDAGDRALSMAGPSASP